MANPHGTPIWYELLTPDHDRARAFYEDVVGWQVGGKPDGDMDYRMISAPDGQVGGVMALTDAMESGGARPGWLFYIGVDDVDAAVARLSAAGGAVLMPAFDLAGVGRLAFVTDPQGTPFYLMRGASEDSSTAWSSDMALGHATWHELSTSDAAAGVAFYRDQFGWENRDTMPMGELGGYHFLDLGERRIGALMRSPDPAAAPHWLIYFQVADVDAAKGRVEAGGGTVTQGPMDVPGGGRIIVAADPDGAAFGLVSDTGKQE
jgi:uncharacterized protein